MLSLALSLVLPSIVAAGPVLELPWPCGATYSCTQSNGGQTSHTGFAQYAWDFGMPLGTDILAVRGGTVLLMKMNSMVGGCSNQYASDANYVVIDHGDGTAGLYMHVEGNSSNFQVGQNVEAGAVIARVGQTGWTCGPHLHYQTQQICGSWWCQSVPSEFFGAGTIAYPESAVSENCGPCTASLNGGQTTISESEVQCFDRLTKWWWEAGEGLDNHHWYTYATAAGQPETLGRWRFSVDTPGDYEVEVHVPATAQSTGATYAVHHAGGVDQVALNQAANKSWQLLGSFYFDGGGDEYIELPDNTGEPEGDLIPLAFDSVRFTYVIGGDGDGDTGDSGDGDGDGDTGDGDSGSGDGDPGDGDSGDGCQLGEAGCMCTMGGGCDPGLICLQGYCTPDNSSSGDSDTGGAGGDDFGGDDGLDFRGTPGCACATAAAPNPREGLLAMPLALLGLAWVARRRPHTIEAPS
ncbi:peptidoglycan DD-metalloendopeptidase family protein [Enhygromyxa salina]|uniref:Murein DD-endopeptidase MepM n=1 Tax=Enhygromyxa salina TaxID=215803 RepID=A0A2S9YJL2_9BACT|nr:peptidoglycan DD-metalloendopeptidase family protein [Enhygromyxa salina]PRQ05250.1 Murein DD-endopeptidase MepM [Enhygromyxa salina]